MAQSRRHKKEKIEIPSSSLADIAFLLLIFFLVCTTINSESGLQMILPGMDEVPVRPKNICNILVNAKGDVMFKGKSADSRSLIALAQEEQETNENVIFSVKTSRGTPYQIYIDVVDALKEARAKRISIADPDDI